MPGQLQLRTCCFHKDNYVDADVEIIKAYCTTQKYGVVAITIIEADDDEGRQEVEVDTPRVMGYIQLHKKVGANKLKKLLANAEVYKAGKAMQVNEVIKRYGVVFECGEMSSNVVAGMKGGMSTKAKWKKITELAEQGAFKELDIKFHNEYIRCYNHIHMLHLDRQKKIKQMHEEVKQLGFAKYFCKCVNENMPNTRVVIEDNPLYGLRDGVYPEESKVVSDNA